MGMQAGPGHAAVTELGQVFRRHARRRPFHKGDQISLIAIRNHNPAMMGQQISYQFQALGAKFLPSPWGGTQHPHGMDGLHIHMKNFGQAAHFDRFIPQNGPYQFAHNQAVMVPAPNIGGQAHNLHSLAYQIGA